jgi:two-component system, NtrC family, sensor kinase
MSGAKQMLERLTDRLNLLAIVVTSAVMVAFLLGAGLFWSHHHRNVTRSAEETARRQADLIRLALEHQMEVKERKLIKQMVQSFAADPTIQQVQVINREGTTRFRGGIEAPAAQVLRVTLPIENRQACHRCHEAQDEVNGALLVDVRADALAQAVNRDIGGPILVIGAIALALLGGISLSLRVLVVRRLEQLERAARAIAEGQLDKRLPVRGSDTLSWMARAFNAMADSVMRMAGELKDQRELLEMVINSVDDGIAVLDRRYRVLAANEAFLSRLGCQSREVNGENCRRLLGAICDSKRCPADGCFRTGERQQSVLTRIGADGTTRVEELHASPIRGANEVVAVVEVWRDITERRATEARLGQSHRMASLGTLASGFSHELNTPLATILTCLESMLRVLGELPEEARDQRQVLLLERARIAREQVIRCRGITQQFLRLARGQVATTDLLELGPISEAVVRLVEPTARERGVTVRCLERGSARATVRANESELQQVMLNLLLNAIQACPSGGTVSVAVVPGPPARLVIEDSGCGIPAEQAERIFEPFYGLRPGGTGLGLFLSSTMARTWGAEVELARTSERGSTFEVRFTAGTSARQAEA